MTGCENGRRHEGRNPTSTEPKQKFEGGATRSVKFERFDLIPAEAELAAARRYGLGARMHGEGNWKHGGIEFIKGAINHLHYHLCALKTQTDWTDTENTDALVWNTMALAYFQAVKPEEFAIAMQELKDGKVENG